MILFNKKKVPVSVPVAIDMNMERIKKELAYVTKVAINNRTVSQFAKEMNMINVKPIMDLINKNYYELPNRGLLRKIASNSRGLVTWKNLYVICGYSESDPEENRSWENHIFKRGEIYTVDLGNYGEGSEQQSKRPFLIISNNKGNKYGSILVGCPLTTKFKNPLLHIPVGTEHGVREKSFVMAEHIRSIDKRRTLYNGGIPFKITTLPESLMLKVQHALEFELGFEPLMFDENKAFRMVEHIRSLEQNVKIKKSHNLIDILNQKMDDLKEYCLKYHKNYKILLQEYDRINNYSYNAMSI